MGIASMPGYRPPRLPILSMFRLREASKKAQARDIDAVTAFANRMVSEFPVVWERMGAEEREWWRRWALNDLPSPKGIYILSYFKWGLVLRSESRRHPDRVEILLAAVRSLVDTILKQISRDVWREAISDPDFVAASQRGHEEILAGRVVRVSRDNL